MKFVSETDTEVISKLIKYMYTLYPDSSFCELVEKTIMQLEGKGFSPAYSLFSNFSCMFLNPNDFFQFEITIVLIY